MIPVGVLSVEIMPAKHLCSTTDTMFQNKYFKDACLLPLAPLKHNTYEKFVISIKIVVSYTVF